jgi:hypothetical protein
MAKKQTEIQKPSNVTALGVLTIVSGALNLLGGAGLTISVVLGTFGLGLLCVPITALPTVLGVFEILYGIKLVQVPPQPVKPSQTLAILELLTFFYFNVISGVVGILALVFYNDPEVKEYFETINA